ncbi:hypothetical protein WJX75_003512 [Coccomyxa subellipsoidea]|uniref:Uncharacterized protein n=1 Tax=Coccomyxa subellipsoidea TaxID=248742 RepID=A0ABR2YE10_9CHLO
MLEVDYPKISSAFYPLVIGDCLMSLQHLNIASQFGLATALTSPDDWFESNDLLPEDRWTEAATECMWAPGPWLGLAHASRPGSITWRKVTFLEEHCTYQYRAISSRGVTVRHPGQHHSEGALLTVSKG